MRQDDFEYAMENTRVVIAPEQQIATFGTTSFHFCLVSELMDQANEVRVRRGHLQADRPQIVAPEHLVRLLLEGFGEQANRYAERLRDYASNVATLRYGFQFRRSDVTEHRVRDTVDSVIGRTRREAENAEQTTAVIHGVDDAWEVCLLKFTIDLIQRSSRQNFGDFRQRGLL
jgi:hypothetical protein